MNRQEVYTQSAPWTLADVGKAIGVVVAGSLLVSLAAAGLAALVVGDGEIEEDSGALAVTIGAGFFIELALIIAALSFSVRKYGVPFSALGLCWPPADRWWHGVVLGVAALGSVYLYFAVLSLAGLSPEVDLPDAVYSSVLPALVLGLLSLAVAPVIEEVFFRGFVFRGLNGRWGLIGAGLASGLVFGLAHLGNPGALYLVLPITVVGAMFAWGFAYSGSLVTPITAHFLFNLVSFGAGLAS